MLQFESARLPAAAGLFWREIGGIITYTVLSLLLSLSYYIITIISIGIG